MNPLVKNILIAAACSVVAYLSIQFVQHGSVTAPTGAGLIQVVVIFIACLVSAMTSGSPVAAPAASTSSGGGSAGMETGTVKWFNVKKGYGFITRDAGDDVFVHYRNIEGQGRRAISEGQRVTFTVVDGDKGLQADKVSGI